MSHIHAALGGGRQGMAAAYDMAKYGDARRILIGDVSLDEAQKCAARANALIGHAIAESTGMSVSNHPVMSALEPIADAAHGDNPLRLCLPSCRLLCPHF